MTNQKNNPRAIVQTAWVVPDLDAAIQHWLNLGYGPFLRIDNVNVPDANYRGRIAPLNLSLSLVQAGDVCVELIQQHSVGPSAYRDVYGPTEGGFHHLCWFSDDYEAEKAAMQQKGYVVATEGLFCGVQFCYVDTRAAFGCMIELVPDGPPIRNMYKAVKEASIGWDGSNPIRSFSL